MSNEQSGVDRRGDCALEITRLFDAKPEVVYRAWSEPALFRRWWVPASVEGLSLLSCEMDVRTGGGYKLGFRFGTAEPMTFFGKYVEVIANERMVWTNEEGEEGGVTTVTFAARDGKTLLSYHERYPTTQAREEAIQGSAAALPEQLDQLEALLASPQRP